MIWSVVQQIGGQVATMIVYFALAALLPPRDFGLVGMAGAWLAVLNAFCETGFGAALIQREQLRGEHLSSTFAVNLAMGAALTLLGIALSYPAARFFSTPDLQPVMAVLSLAFLMRAFGLTQVALAQRELRFRALAVARRVGERAGRVRGLALALAGYGVWSLVGMTLVNGLVCDRSWSGGWGTGDPGSPRSRGARWPSSGPTAPGCWASTCSRHSRRTSIA